MSTKAYSEISFCQNHWNRIFTPCVSPFISNLRDINRLSNTLKFKLTTIASEIDFADMIAISAIEIGVPSVFEWIKSNKELLTGGKSTHKFGMTKNSQQDWLSFYKGIIDKLLNENSDDPSSTFITFSHLIRCCCAGVNSTTINAPFITALNFPLASIF